jgi:hypothetical protein
MSDEIRYITDDTGTQIGVLLDLDAYRQLSNSLLNDRQCLVSLSRDELLALAHCKISLPKIPKPNSLKPKRLNSIEFWPKPIISWS